MVLKFVEFQHVLLHSSHTNTLIRTHSHSHSPIHTYNLIIFKITTRFTYPLCLSIVYSLVQLFIVVKLFQLYKQKWIGAQWVFVFFWSVLNLIKRKRHTSSVWIIKLFGASLFCNTENNSIAYGAPEWKPTGNLQKKNLWNFSPILPIFFSSRILNFMPLFGVQMMFFVQFTFEIKSNRFCFLLPWYPCHEDHVQCTLCTKCRQSFQWHVEKSEQIFHYSVQKNRIANIVNLCNQFTANGEKNSEKIPAVNSCGKNKKWWCFFVWLWLLLSFHHGNGNGNGNTRTWKQVKRKNREKSSNK